MGGHFGYSRCESNQFSNWHNTFLMIRFFGSAQHVTDFEDLLLRTPNKDKAIELAEERQILRNEKRFHEADKIRAQIRELGFMIKDTKDSFELIAIRFNNNGR